MGKLLWIGLCLIATLSASPQVRLFDSVQIESNFDGEPAKYSYGVLLEGGYVLGVESSLLKQNRWARNNRIKILDTLGYPIIYFALIEPYAIDRDQKIVLYKIISFTDPYGNQTDMNRFHLDILKKRGASFIPKVGSAKRMQEYRKENKNRSAGANMPQITKAQKTGVYYLANEERRTKSMLFYPYTRKGLEKITRSQLEVYLKEYEKVPKDLIFYTELKRPSQPKIIDIKSELKTATKDAKAKKETPIPGMYSLSSLSNVYPPNPVGAPVWKGNGDLEGIIVASRPQDNLMLNSTRIFQFFCAIAFRGGYEEALQKRILKSCPENFKK